MALADRPTTPPPPQKGPVCSTTKLLTTMLTPADAAWLQDRLDDPRWTTSDIARALRDEGIHIDSQTLGRHRRGECRCER